MAATPSDHQAGDRGETDRGRTPGPPISGRAAGRGTRASTTIHAPATNNPATNQPAIASNMSVRTFVSGRFPELRSLRHESVPGRDAPAP